MSAQGNGLTLEALAQRLEALEGENERMRSENAELRQEVSALRSSGTTMQQDELAALRDVEARRDGEPTPFGPEGQVSRRALLSKVGAAAVAAVAASTLLGSREAKAHSGFPVVQAETVSAHQVDAFNHVNDGFAVRAGAATSAFDQGAVQAQNTGSGPGVYGDGPVGVWGRSAKSGYASVYGQHTGTYGYGLVGDGTGSGGAGVLGRNSVGYGGQFEGGKAQLKLVPKPAGTTGKPSGAHSKGEIYMDSAGALFVCVKGGNPATWRKVSTTAV